MGSITLLYKRSLSIAQYIVQICLPGDKTTTVVKMKYNGCKVKHPRYVPDSAVPPGRKAD